MPISPLQKIREQTVNILVNGIQEASFTQTALSKDYDADITPNATLQDSTVTQRFDWSANSSADATEGDTTSSGYATAFYGGSWTVFYEDPGASSFNAGDISIKKNGSQVYFSDFFNDTDTDTVTGTMNAGDEIRVDWEERNNNNVNCYIEFEMTVPQPSTSLTVNDVTQS